MPLETPWHFVLGPVVALCVMGVIALICRWVFSTDERDARTARRLEKALSSRDFGLLVPVATVRTRDDAEMLRDVLREGGVRASVVDVDDDLQVLVFPRDEDAARRLVGTP